MSEGWLTTWMRWVKISLKIISFQRKFKNNMLDIILSKPDRSIYFFIPTINGTPWHEVHICLRFFAGESFQRLHFWNLIIFIKEKQLSIRSFICNVKYIIQVVIVSMKILSVLI